MAVNFKRRIPEHLNEICKDLRTNFFAKLAKKRTSPLRLNFESFQLI